MGKIQDHFDNKASGEMQMENLIEALNDFVFVTQLVPHSPELVHTPLGGNVLKMTIDGIGPKRATMLTNDFAGHLRDNNVYTPDLVLVFRPTTLVDPIINPTE